jgi:triosephosphate isomerase
MRQALIVGNWKMHGSRAGVEELLGGLAGGVGTPGAEVAVCPTFVHLQQAVARCAGSPIAVGAQDCSHMQSGAYTGEVAASMLGDLGCSWVILGHSERRQYHAESEELVAAKLAAAVDGGLLPIVCVGETREQRESGEAEAIVGAQLRGALAEQASLAGLVVAYEPVWAIGTGLTATPEQAQEMHAYIRECLAGINGVDAAATRVLYGGSVKAGNAAELFAGQDIDGALVGGAALVVEDFLAIIAAAQ